MKDQEKKKYSGTPPRDRSKEDIADALAGQDDFVVDAFQRAATYMREKQLGLSRFATQCGISNGVLSGCFNGNYPGRPDEIANRLLAFFNRLDQKARYGGIQDFVKTRLAVALFSAFDQARVTRRIRIIQGPEQAGKTRISQEYTGENNHGFTRYSTIRRSMESMGDYIHGLAHEIGIATDVKLREKKFRIMDCLAATELLFIDEAHLIFKWNLKEQQKILDYIRTDLFDNGKRGIVLLVTDDQEVGDFMSGLLNIRAKTRYNMGQLIGRMSLEPYLIDGTDDLPECDVEALVERYYKPGRRVMARLTKLAQAERSGRLGRVLEIMTQAWTVAKAKKKELDDDIVNAEIDTSVAALNTYKNLTT